MNRFVLISVFLFLAVHIIFPVDSIFWDNEKNIEKGNISKFSIFKNDNIFGLVYSDNGQSGNLFFKYTSDAKNWSSKKNIISGFYSGEKGGVDFASLLDGELLYVFYRTGLNNLKLVRIDISNDNDDVETLYDISSENIIYLPEIYKDSAGDFHLLYAENTDSDVLVMYKKLDSRASVILESNIGGEYKNALNPSFFEKDGIIYIALQAKNTAIQGGLYYNIIVAYSEDFGKTWNYKTLVSSEGENNQRPNIIISGKNLNLVWEKEDRNFISHIHYKMINLSDWKEIYTKTVSSLTTEAHSPYLLEYEKNIYVFWYDNQENNFQVYFSQFINNQFTEPELLREKAGRTFYLYPFLFKNKPVVAWIQNSRQSADIYVNKTVTDVSMPSVFIRNIREIEGTRYINKKEFRIEWKQEDNPAGIEGFRYLFTKNKDEKINFKDKILPYYNRSYDVEGLLDGHWYFKIKTYDNAGNESNEEIYELFVDTTPPPPPELDDPVTDDKGNLADNYPGLSWDEKSGNTFFFNLYRKFFLNQNDPEIERTINMQRLEKFSSTAEKNWKSPLEYENGIFLFGVQGVDRAGNESSITWGEYPLSHFVATTVISRAELRIADNGENILYIFGKGFKNQGEIMNIYIDKNRSKPYDYEFGRNDFTIVNDNLIKGHREFPINDGSYYIGLEHETRGLTFDNARSVFSSRWAFKYQKENYFNFKDINFLFREFNLTTAIIISVIIFWIIIIFILMISVVNTGRERIYVRTLLSKLDRIKDELKSEEYFARRQIVMKKGLGLTIKYTFLILLLVISIVVSTSVAISFLSLSNERKNLAYEMKDKAGIMMNNFEVSLVDIYTLEKGYTEAIDSTANAAKAADINFVLFKLAEDNSVLIRYGTNRKIKLNGIDVTKMPDNDRNKIVTEMVFNEENDKNFEILKSNYEGTPLIYPLFDPVDLKENYVFIKPVIINRGDEKVFIGEIAIGFSFERIITTIYEESLVLFRIALIVTGIAIFLSIIGAIFLATTTIRPIKKISSHVENITTKEDYEELVSEGKDEIKVKSKDEIGILAVSINEMTHKLIEKARADKQLLLGKEIQKKFITMEPLENDLINIYGYYEGAKGVSGDYFEYKKINDEYYAFIICDVSGKAVPAALIMVQISTIFHSYFSTFKIGEDKLDTVEIVKQINDTIEERGFQGRFAAIMVMILNVKTGEGILTNAGYTQMLIYREAKKECEWVKLFQSGAAGVFPSYMLPDPFQLEKIKMNRGDIIFLFTDGIEESRNGKKIVNENGDEIFEEFGNDRIKIVIDNARYKSPEKIIRELIKAENDFRGEMEQYDDLTILGIHRK